MILKIVTFRYLSEGRSEIAASHADARDVTLRRTDAIADDLPRIPGTEANSGWVHA
jgi:hypothetical protein